MVIMNRSEHHQAWLDVAVFENVENGRVLEGFFRDNGIESRTYDDKAFRYFLFLRPPRVTWRVQVRKNHFEEAVKLIEAKNPAVLDRAIHCPSCGSLRVNYPQMTRKFVLPTVLLHLGILSHIIEHQCYCEHCHEMWNLPKANARVQDAHAAKPIAF
jgi:hypothetical protein